MDLYNSKYFGDIINKDFLALYILCKSKVYANMQVCSRAS